MVSASIPAAVSSSSTVPGVCWEPVATKAKLAPGMAILLLDRRTHVEHRRSPTTS